MFAKTILRIKNLKISILIYNKKNNRSPALKADERQKTGTGGLGQEFLRRFQV